MSYNVFFVSLVYSRMAGRSDKVETSMNSHVKFFGTVWLLFLTHERLMLIVNEIDNWNPTITVVDVIAKSRSIYDG